MSSPDGWEVVIGMEVHVQPKTLSKMFCDCGIAPLNAEPNTYTCPVCLGLPGVLPVINRAAVEAVLKTALSLNCEIPRHTKWDRKNYMYPDLPKGYQISQYDLPMSVNGHIEIGERRVRIRRVHLEEDTGKLVHAGDKLQKAWESYVDLNRAGVPLMEIVSEPDIHSAEEARDYGMELQRVLRYVGASEADMEKGQMRVEPNISIRRAGSKELGVKTELKNINSFRALYRAIGYEVDRQQQLIESGGMVVQETRGWSEAEGRTFSQRSKEFAEDYRYFPEPDLPPLELDRAWIEELQASLPELPAIRRARLVSTYGLRSTDADLIVDSRGIADLFEATAAPFEQFPNPAREYKQIANWIISEVRPRAREDGLGRLNAVNLAILIQLVEEIGQITRDQGRRVLDETMRDGTDPNWIARQFGFVQERDTNIIDKYIDEVIREQPKVWGDYVAGNDRAGGVIIGKVRTLSNGTAKPELISKRISEIRDEQRVRESH